MIQNTGCEHIKDVFSRELATVQENKMCNNKFRNKQHKLENCKSEQPENIPVTITTPP